MNSGGAIDDRIKINRINGSKIGNKIKIDGGNSGIGNSGINSGINSISIVNKISNINSTPDKINDIDSIRVNGNSFSNRNDTTTSTASMSTAIVSMTEMTSTTSRSPAVGGEKAGKASVS